MRLLALATLLPLSTQANPILDGADPHAAVVGREYWIFPTEAHSRDPIFAAYRSTDLRTWKREGTILDLDKIPWVKADGAPWHGAWAPALATKNGKFYFYYSVGPQHPTPSRIGVASGPSPAGPFTDSGKPLLTGFEGFEAIDPMVFVDPDAGGKPSSTPAAVPARSSASSKWRTTCSPSSARSRSPSPRSSPRAPSCTCAARPTTSPTATGSGTTPPTPSTTPPPPLPSAPGNTAAASSRATTRTRAPATTPSSRTLPPRNGSSSTTAGKLPKRTPPSAAAASSPSRRSPTMPKA